MFPAISAGAPGAAQRAAAELRFAFEHVGFYYLAGHGVPQSLIDMAYAEAARFHAQPLEEKLAVKVDEHNIGYMPIAREAAAQCRGAGQEAQPERGLLPAPRARPRRSRRARQPPLPCHEQVAGREDLPGFRAQHAGLHGHDRGAVQKARARSMRWRSFLPETFFDACFAEPHMILRMSRYPVIDGADDTIASLVPHTDSGFMTLLPPNKVQGLSILLPDGRWMDAPGVEDAFVVNGGDILHRWTNERFLSTPHRVRNVSGTAALRHAVLLRSQPRHDDRVPADAASRPSSRPSIRRSSSATMRCGSPPSATSTWPRCRRRPKPRSRRARAPRHAGMRRRADVQEHSRAHPVGPVHPADGDAPIIAR